MSRIPEKRKLLEDAWVVLANMDPSTTTPAYQESVRNEIYWARTVIELANSLPESTGPQDRPFREAIT